MRIVCFLMLLIVFGTTSSYAYQDTSLNKSISEQNIRFINYPDFPEAHSTWGSIGYNPANNNVYVGVTNHADKVGFYEYDPAFLTKSSYMASSVIWDTWAAFSMAGKNALQNLLWDEGVKYISLLMGASREKST